MIKVETFIFNSFAENTYIVFDNLTKETFIVDPGCNDKREEKELDDFISSNELLIKFVFNTHGHIDHILGNQYIKRKFSPLFYYPQNELHFFDLMEQQAAIFGVSYNKPDKPNYFFDESIELYIGNYLIKFISTPGHSPDEFCIYLPNENICFTGDVLFKESIGRTDLWGGDYNTLLNSISNKIYTLPPNTIIYPGHGDKTSIKYETEFNPFIKKLIN
ncbi:MAG TPA: MBL fold metallo-hydrolase [Melioribacteraceae bacterium]|nr:MBL fold metallo-hydrolase [Melioribacteraceae bacterium]